MTLSFDSNSVLVSGVEILLPWPVLQVVEQGSQIFVLLDPDAYLKDASYMNRIREGDLPIKNLMAFSRNGEKLWEAEFPENPDYYYKIVSGLPLVVNSFSSHRCEIDSQDGSIKRIEFLK